MPTERLRWMLTKLRRVFRRGREEAFLDAEMQFHFDQLVEQFRAEGLSPREAHFAAQREFGAGVAAYREEIRDTWRPPQLADLWRNIHFAGRSLGRTPGFTALAIVTLAFGIGGNTMMFSAFRTVLLKPLPYPENEQLDRLDRATPQNRKGRVSPADFNDLRRSDHPFEQISAYTLGDASLSDKGQPAEMVRALRATTSLFSTLRVIPQVGRDFRAGEDLPGRDRVVMIGHRCWQRRYNAEPDVIGRTIRVDGDPHTIVGVLPAWFNEWRHLGAIDIFRPLPFDDSNAADRQSTILRIIGRRPKNVPASEAAAFVARFGAGLARDFPEVHTGTSWNTIPLNETVFDSQSRSMLTLCIGLSGFVLLIACSNLTNLLLARTMARAREFAVRAAIGASRRQLLGPLVVESVLLALAGGVCAIIVAQWGAEYLAIRSTGDNGERVYLAFDWLVFAWAFGAALFTAVAFGLAPALFALRLNLVDTLKSGARGSTASRGHHRFRQLLIVGQFALAMILLAGAALFIRGLDELNRRREGWESRHLLTGSMVLPLARYSNPEEISAFQHLVLERVQALPGVAAASVSSFTPFFEWPDLRKFHVEGRELAPQGREAPAVMNSVSPQYFRTFETRLLAGRTFAEADKADAPKVYVVSQATAAGLFGQENPIGRRLRQVGGADVAPGEIVGVVADVKSIVPDVHPVTFRIYQPMAQEPRPLCEIALRTNGVAPGTLVESVRNLMTELDPDLPVRNLQPADATIYRANYQTAVLRDLLTGFAMLGLGLASLGVYGVITRTMAQRTSEFAVRVALGACLRDIRNLVLVSGVKLALIGSVLGLLGAIAVARLLAAGHPGMRLHSPSVLAATTLLLILVALLASWLPARRATRINPMDALRNE